MSAASGTTATGAAAVISSIAAGQGKTTKHTETHNTADEAKARDMTLATLNKDQKARLAKSGTSLADIEKKNQEAVKAGVASEKAEKTGTTAGTAAPAKAAGTK